MNNLGGYPESRIKLFANILVLIVSLYGVSQKNFTTSTTPVFETWMIEAFAPIQERLIAGKREAENLFSNYLLIVNTNRENEFLWKEVKGLREHIFTLEEAKKENERLKSLMAYTPDVPHQKILANVIAKDASSFFKVIRIDRGEDDGIKVKSPVITADGLVGHVYRTSKKYADVLTILDPNNRVDAIVARTRTHGIVEGYRDSICRMKHVVRSEEISKGDVIITAGLGQLYPKGIRVGTIRHIEKESYGITQSVEVEPAVDFYKLEDVTVLIRSEAAREIPVDDKEKEEKELRP